MKTKLIKQLENIINFPLSELNEKSFIETLKSENFINIFNSPDKILSLIEDLLSEDFDNNFKKELFTVKESIQLVENENIIALVFENYKKGQLNRKEVKEKLESYFESTDPSFVLSTALCYIIGLQDKDILNFKEIIAQNLEKLKDEFQNLGRMETSYTIRCSLVDLVYALRENLYQLTEYDISDKIKWIDDETDKLIEYKKTYISPLRVDIPPEKMGFIDITKLNKKE